MSVLNESDYDNMPLEQREALYQQLSKEDTAAPVPAMASASAASEAAAEAPNPTHDYYNALQSSISRLANLSVGTSLAAQQGLDNAITPVQLGFTQILDGLGLHNAEVTKQEAANLQARKTTTELETGALGIPSAVNQGIQLIGEGAVATALTGGSGPINRMREMVTPVAGKVVGNMAGGFAGGAIYGAEQYAPDGLSGRIANTIGAGSAGALMSGATSVLGLSANKAQNWMQERWSGSIDPKAQEAFKTVSTVAPGSVNITPLASEVQADKSVRQTYSLGDNVANNTPFFGFAGKNARRFANLDKNYVLMGQELDKKIQASPTAALYQVLDDKISPLQTYDLSNVKQAAAAGAKDLGQSLTQGLSSTATQIIDNVNNLGPLNFQQLKNERTSLNKTINDIMVKGDPGWSQEVTALSKVTNAMTEDMRNIAKANGVLNEFEQANASHQVDLAQQTMRSIIPRAFSGNRVGSPDVGVEFDGKWGIEKMNMALNRVERVLDARNLKLPEDDQLALNAFRVVGNTMNQSPTPKKGFNLSVAGKWGGLAAILGTAAAYAKLPAAIVGGAAIKGMSLMLSTETGTKVLAGLGDAIAKAKIPEKVWDSAAARSAIFGAVLLGHADNIKNPGNSHREFPSTFIPDYDSMPLDQREMLLKQLESQ